jgi:hypothetical protein
LLIPAPPDGWDCVATAHDGLLLDTNVRKASQIPKRTMASLIVSPYQWELIYAQETLNNYKHKSPRLFS